MPLGAFRLNSISKAIGTAFSTEYLTYGSTAAPYIDTFKISETGAVTSPNGKRPPNPPTSTYSRIDITSDGSYMVFSHTRYPYVSIFKNVSGTWSRIDPTTLPSFGNTPYAVRWSPNGNYLLVTGSSPIVAVYSRSGDTLTQLTNPAGLPTNAVYAAHWNPANSNQFAIAAAISPYLLIYTISGNTYSLTTSDSTIGGNAFAVDWNSTGTSIAVGYATAPYVKVYDFNGTTLTAAGAATSAGSTPQQIRWLPDDTGFGLVNGTSPYYHFYTKSGTTITKQTLSLSVTPTQTTYGLDFSPDSATLYLATSSTPLYAYTKSGNTYTRITTITNPPVGPCLDVTWSAALSRLVTYSTDYPFIRTFSRSGNTFTSTEEIFLRAQTMVNTTNPPGSQVNAAKLNPQGTHLVTASNASTYVAFYSFNAATEKFTKLTNPATLPANTGVSVAWNNTGDSLAVGTVSTTNAVYIYNRSGDTFTYVTQLATAAGATAIDWNHDGSVLAVGLNASPWIRIYNRTGDSFSVSATPPTLSAAVNSVSWNSDGTTLAISSTVTPFIYFFNYSGGTFTQTSPNPTNLPSANPYQISWQPNGTKVAIACQTGTFPMIIYNRSGNTFTKISDPTGTPSAFTSSIGRGVAWNSSGNILTLTTTAGIAHYTVSGNTVTYISANSLNYPAASNSTTYTNEIQWIKPA